MRSRLLLITSVFVGCLYSFPAWSACTGTDSPWTCTPDRESIAACIAGTGCFGFASGDTINVSDGGDGAETWSSQLIITKGVNLIGPGKSNLTITSGFACAACTNTFSTSNYLIVYNPSNPSLNEPFRLSGFTIDTNGICGGVMLTGGTTTNKLTQVRIDNNEIKNADSPNGSMRGVLVCGVVYGVIDNNVFTDNEKSIDSYGTDRPMWEDLSVELGTANSIYYEDNVFNSWSSFHSSGAGGRYVSRFNTYTLTHSGNGEQTIFDLHGNQNGGNYGTMQGEIYKNTVNAYDNFCFNQRGATARYWGNVILRNSKTFRHWIGEEYADELYPAANDFLMHVTNSYYWSNTVDGSTLYSGDSRYDVTDCCNAIDENDDYYIQVSSFNGTVGVGVGTRSQMDAISTCTNGVGYWVTDEGTWNTSGSGEQGRLYKCNSNSWVLSYTPYTYPHPLRNEADTTAPTLSVSQGSFVTVRKTRTTTLTGTCSDAVGVSWAKWRRGAAPDADNGTSCTGTTSWSCAVTDLGGGSNDIRIGCADAAGNVGTTTVNVEVTKRTWFH